VTGQLTSYQVNNVKEHFKKWRYVYFKEQPNATTHFTDKNVIPTIIDGNIARLLITGVGDQVVYPIYTVEMG